MESHSWRRHLIKAIAPITTAAGFLLAEASALAQPDTAKPPANAVAGATKGDTNNPAIKAINKQIKRCNRHRKTDEKELRSLTRDLGSDDFPPREKASRELEAIGYPAIAALKVAAQDANLERSHRARAILSEFYDRIATLALLIESLGKERHIEEAVVPVLIGLLENNKPGLLYTLRAENVSVRLAALSVLQYLSPGTKGVTCGFMAALRDCDAGIRLEALTLMIRLGMDRFEAREKELGPLLVKLFLTDENASVRAMAIAGLKDTRKEYKIAVPKLVQALADTSAKVRMNAAHLLGIIGYSDAKLSAPAALPALMNALGKDADPDVRRLAARAMGYMGVSSEKAIPVFIDALRKDEDGWVRIETAWSIRHITTDKKRIVPVLVDTLHKDTDADARRAAAYSLGFMPSESKTIIPELMKALDKESGVHTASQIAESLGNFGPEAKAALPALKKIATIKPKSGLQQLLRNQAIKAIAAIENKKDLGR